MKPSLHTEKPVIFTAYSKRNFYQAMLISRFVFEQGAVPINPFTNFGFFLYELVDRDLVRIGNNNLVKRSDELWVFGDIADGVLSEIKLATAQKKPIRYFDISDLPDTIVEVRQEDLPKEP